MTFRERRLLLLAWAVATRVVVLATAVGVHLLRWPKGFFGSAQLGHALGILGSWDGLWYERVARHGYLLIPGRQSDPAFFPLYPILLRAAHTLGAPYLVAGVAISNVAFLLAILGLYELGREVVSEDLAWRGALLAAASPIGFVCSMLYPESIVFAALILALLSALRGRWVASAAAGSIAALGRPEAVLFAIPIAAVAYRRRPQLDQQQRSQAVAAVLAPAISAASFPLYLGWTLHNVYAWSWAQRAWGRSFQPAGIVHAFAQLGTSIGYNHWLIRDVAFTGVSLFLLALAYRAGVGRAWLAAGLLVVFLPLTTGSFVSQARFGLLAIPVYWGLASIARRRVALVALLSVSTALLVAGTLTLPFTYP